MEIAELQKLLETRLPKCEFFVDGDGRHFSVIAVSDEFIGLSKLKSQQYIYAALSEEFAQGLLHALEIQTFSHEAWQNTQA